MNVSQETDITKLKAVAYDEFKDIERYSQFIHEKQLKLQAINARINELEAQADKSPAPDPES
jgi:BMFP domain-containing protein YqiC